MASATGETLWRRRGLTNDLIIWGIVLLAWGLAVVASLTGADWVLSHHVLLEESTLPWLAGLLLFLAAWQVMTAGMMLPSALPLVHLFHQASRQQDHARLVQTVFLVAYFAVWSAFAIAAFVADTGLHALVDRWAWLDQRPWLIASGTLLIAGGFQFSPLKEQCLTACRSPQSFLWRYYQRGLAAAWWLGVRHGLFCLGCCWALMLTMFGLGIGNLAWMAGMTGVMVIEKTARRGRQLAPVIGVTLLLWGALVLLQPAWLPIALGGP